MADTEKKLDFESSLAELEKIVDEMESGRLPLDVMMAKFERGRKLATFCSTELTSIRQRIEKVVAKSNEPPRVEPLDLTNP